MATAFGILALLASLLFPAAPARGEAVVEPLQPGWEQFFRVEWEAGTQGDGQVVRGRVRNDSPYLLDRIQLLVEALDQGGAVLDQQVVWLNARGLEPFTGASFEVQARRSAPQYRVRVYSYERLEGDSRE